MGHRMTDKTEDNTLSVQIANQIINVANSRLEDGADPEDVATGMRHAAANFSAFTASHGDIDPNILIGEFAEMLGYYMERHSPQESAPSGFLQLIDQAKNEL
jgi:hypothetical protein